MIHILRLCGSLYLLDSCAHKAWCKHLSLSLVSEFSCSKFTCSCSRFKGHCSINHNGGSRPLGTSFLFILIRPSSWFWDRSSNWLFFCLCIFEQMLPLSMMKFFDWTCLKNQENQHLRIIIIIMNYCYLQKSLIVVTLVHCW